MNRWLLVISLLVLLSSCLPALAQTAAPAPDPAAPWQPLVTDGLRDAAGGRVELAAIEGKIVGLYFSAHWCPPCRAFSPKLVEFRNAHQKDFEVVFVSSDKSEEDQFTYMKEVNMPWPVVPYKSQPVQELKGKYGIRSIPTLIICSPKGKVITTQGRQEVSDAPDACIARWQEKAAELDR